MIVKEVKIDRNLVDVDRWPFHVPSVTHIVQHGLAFSSPVTFLVGENGSGKSTIIEAIAEAYGLDAHGGRAGRKFVNDRPKTPLGEVMKLNYTPIGRKISAIPKNRKGYFLRAETAHGFMSFVTGMYGYWEKNVMEMSHGEGFLEVLDTMFTEKGLYLLDEPEAALSFSSCLRLVAILNRLSEIGAQVICATHSPILTALPEADILELNTEGINRVPWKNLELVDHWQRFLSNPSSYLRHFIDQEN